MLGKRSPQENLFTLDHQYLSFVGEDSFYGYLAAHRHELFSDDDFALLYCADNGRTSVPPSLLACALLLQWYENVGDQEAVDRSKYDLRWKVALGLKMDEEPFVKSTLWLFRTQLIVHEEAQMIFKRSLTHARRKGFFKSPKLKAVLDITPIFGKGAVEDTYNLLAESLRQVLRVLAELEDNAFEQFACEHDFRRYTEPSFKGSVSIDWDNEVERQAVLTSLVADCDRVLVLARKKLASYSETSDEAHRITQASELLSKILVQDVRRTPTGEAELIDGVAKDRIVSVHDPEMPARPASPTSVWRAGGRHGRKSASQRFDGYKGAVAVDPDSQLITAVDVLPGNAHDAENAQALITHTEQNTQAAVETVIGDTAYGSVEQRLEAQADQRTLIAPMPKQPQTGRFTKDDFQIDLVTEKVTCPAGKTASQWYPHRMKTKRGKAFTHKTFSFAQDQCQGCPWFSQCVKPGACARTITVHEREALLQAAKQFQRTEEFRTLYRQRSTAEHRIARLIQLGLRQARYFGTKKTMFQLAMVAAVANLTLIAASEANTVFLLSILRFLGLLVLVMLVLGSVRLLVNAPLNSCPRVRAIQNQLVKTMAFRPGF